jgi:ABC-type microcin C transport system permease subunit YejE
LLLFSWVALVGIVRAEFLRGRNFEYVNAARALGVGNRVIMWRHLLPNAMVATLTFMPFILSGSITTLTALDFLGFGLPAGSPSLGELLAQGKNNLQAPWLGLTGFAVTIGDAHAVAGVRRAKRFATPSTRARRSGLRHERAAPVGASTSMWASRWRAVQGSTRSMI